jgi:hypothetical protein
LLGRALGGWQPLRRRNGDEAIKEDVAAVKEVVLDEKN